MSSFTDTNVPININVGLSLVGATNLKLVMKKPDNTIVEKTSPDITTDGNQTVIWSNPALTDFNLRGWYRFQVFFTKGTNNFKSKIIREHFFEHLQTS